MLEDYLRLIAHLPLGQLYLAFNARSFWGLAPFLALEKMLFEVYGVLGVGQLRAAAGRIFGWTKRTGPVFIKLNLVVVSFL